MWPQEEPTGWRHVAEEKSGYNMEEESSPLLVEMIHGSY